MNVGLLETVSRETSERLTILHDLLQKWNPKINLVAKSTLSTAWERHILDSVQIFKLAPNTPGAWCDLGSGGGFPGLVVAILAADVSPVTRVTLIESDQRKCLFLKTVLRETGVSARVLTDRIENAPAQSADVISARALADLDALFGFAVQHGTPSTICLFPKGHRWKDEAERARLGWSFDLEQFKSETDDNAAILRVKNIYAKAS